MMSMKKNTSILFGIFIGLSLFFAGCVEEGNVANVVLDSYTHAESVGIGEGFVSDVTFTMSNEGLADADNVQLRVLAYNEDDTLLYDEEMSVDSTLAQEETTTEEVTIDYELGDNEIRLEITISWDGGSNSYTRTYLPEQIE